MNEEQTNHWQDHKVEIITGLLILIPVCLLIALILATEFIAKFLIH